MMDVNLAWIHCTGKEWCRLTDVDLSQLNPLIRGVYLIWQTSGRVVYVGSGNIRDRLENHRIATDILVHADESGILLVTWARVVHEAYIEPIERYLTAMFNPIVSGNHTKGQQITVNPPTL